MIEAIHKISSGKAINIFKVEQYEISPYGELIELASSRIGLHTLLKASSILENLKDENYTEDDFFVGDEPEQENLNIEPSQLLTQLEEALEEQDAFMVSVTAYALGREGCKKSLQQLISALKSSTDVEISWAVADAIVRADECSTLQSLWEIHLDKPTHRIHSAIAAIQSHCRFYNYEIYRASRSEAADATVQKQSSQGVTNVTNININSGANVGGVNVDSTVYGSQTGANYSYLNDESLKQEITELRQLVSQLQQNHQPTTEAEAIQVIDAEFHEIQKTNPSRWQTIQKQLQLLKRQLLNPERHLTASKAAIAEVAKHYLEDSVLAKALITYFDTMSADTDQGE